MRKSEVNPFEALGILEKSAELKIPQEQKRPANHVCSIYDNRDEKSLYGKKAGDREINSLYPKPREKIFASFSSDDNQQDVVQFSENSIEGEEPATVCCPSFFQEFGQMFLERLLGLER